MVSCELTEFGCRLRIEIRELLAVRAHACPKVATWIANEALGHRRVALGFGCVTIRERREVRSEARVIARLCSLDELLHFDRVQQSRWFLLCRHARSERQDGNRSDRQ